MDDDAARPHIGSIKVWWSGTLQYFVKTQDEHILGQLAASAMQAFRTNEAVQLRAWAAQIESLRPALAQFPQNWRLALEYPLIRLGRRLDAVLITDRAIIIIEFKTLGGSFTTEARYYVSAATTGKWRRAPVLGAIAPSKPPDIIATFADSFDSG